MKRTRTMLTVIALAGLAFGEERHYVWSGVTVHEGKTSGRAVSTFDEALAKKARAGGHAASFRKELAEVRLAIDVDGKLEETSKKLEDLHVRAAWALDYEGRMDVLVEIAKLRTELFTSLGRKDEALQAVSVLLLDESARKAAAATGYELVPADDKTLAQEKEALGDTAIAELRRKLSSRPGPSQLPAPNDEIEAAVYQAVSEKRPFVISQIGPRAAPALEKIILSKPDELPDQVEQDLLSILFEIARLRGGQFVLGHLDAGGFFWKKRILRAMAQAEVINDHEPPVEPVWLAILENLASDPEVGREALYRIAYVVKRNVLTPGLEQAMLRALDSGDPDLSTDVMAILRGGCGNAAKPLIEKLLRHTNEAVRRSAAEQMFCWSSSDAFLACVDHEDPAMRRQLARFLKGRSAPNGAPVAPKMDEAERAVLARLAVDSDPSVRAEAIFSMRELKPPLAPEIYERLVADQDPNVLAQVDDLLLILLGRPENRAPWFVRVLEKRRANPALPIGRSFNESEKTSFARLLLETEAGTPLVFRWALEERDDKLLEVAVANVRSQPERVLDQPATTRDKPPPSPKGVFVLNDATLEKAYRRSFDVAKEAFTQLNEGLAHPWWGSKARAGAVLPVLLDASAPRELRVAAASVAAMRGGDAIVDGVEKLLADPAWSTAGPSDFERRSLGRILDGLPRADRVRVALFAIRTTAVSDSVASAFLVGFQDRNAFPAEAARPALDRWFDATGPQLADPWVDVLRLAIQKLPSQLPDETVARYIVRALDMGGLRYVARDKISELRWPVFLEVLGKRVRACDFEVVSPLGAYMDDRAAELLLEAMGACPNEEFRKTCLAALDSIRKYQDEKAHWTARKNGQQARDEAVAKLLPMLADADEKIRAQAVLSLATLDAVEHLPRLVEMLKDKSPAVREAAARALEKLNRGDGKKP